MGPPRGLQLNRSKSLLYLPPDVDPGLSSLPSDIPTTSAGFELLGCPIGPPDYFRDVISRRLSKIKESVQLLSLLENSQVEYSLLRVCLGLQKMKCVLRTTPPDILFPILQDFDSFMFHCINDLVGGALSDWSHLQVLSAKFYFHKPITVHLELYLFYCFIHLLLYIGQY